MPPETYAVLHLEASDRDAALVRGRLEQAGLAVRVERATDREGFESRLREGRHDLILSDEQVPTLGGLAALRLARERRPDAPFLFVVAETGEDFAVETLRQGATDYLVKERLARLPAAVERAVTEAREHAEREHAAAALRASEARKSAILDAALDAVISIDHEGKVVEFNPAAERICGYRREEALGRELAELIVPPALRERHRRGLAHYLATGEGPVLNRRIELPAMRADGSEFPVELSITPIEGQGAPLFIGYLRDVTERKRTEERLRTSEGQLRFLDALGEAMRAEADPAAVMAAATRRLGEHLGVTRCAYADLEPDNDRFTIRDDWRTTGATTTAGTYRLNLFGARAAAEIRAGRTLIVRDVDAEFDAADGGAAMFNAIGIKAIVCCPLVKDGRLRAMMAVHQATPRDWTADEIGLVGEAAERSWAHIERVRSAAALRESEERLRIAVEAAKLGQWTLDLPTNELTCSDGCKANYGRQPGDRFTVEDLWQSVHPDDQDRVRADVRQAIDLRTDYDVEYRVAWPDGEERWIMVRGRAVYAADGAPQALTGVTLDITARKRAEAEIRESRERLAFALEAADLGQWDLNLNDRTAGRTPRHDQIFGYDAPLPEWTYQMFLEHVLPEDRPAVDASFQEAQAVGTAWEVECRIRRADGAERWIWTKALFRRNPDRRIGRLLGIVGDMTERKQAEEALRRIAAELSEADRRKDEFLATLAHELRNPLAPIRTGLEVLRLAENDPATVGTVRDTMERQVQQLAHLIDDLMDVSRITRGKFQLRTRRVTLAEVARSALEAARPFVDEAGHELTVALPEEPVELEADPHRLAQVLSNLLNNAAKYTPRGGRIALTAERRGGEAVVTVADNGLGIPADSLSRIFEMFAQIDRESATEASETGLGIGLTLVRSLVEMHGGRVEVHSEGAGRGSEFRVRLPIAGGPPAAVPQAAPETDAAADSEGAADAPARRVLVVDDNKAAARMLGRVLGMLGHEVHLAHDGVEAIEAAGAVRPDLALMDLGMPNLNGYEAARRIRDEPWGAEMVLVALTGWGQEEDRRRTREAGFDRHLVKPVEPAVLQQLLAQLRRPADRAAPTQPSQPNDRRA
ncbi:PAS domain S-box protein [Alienimonas californiensis]|uniref:histidine kinase n=1 Tax=Alienimonas californiensis TaxID=2527989 RepID=A0A517P6L8_9PLAN|nr:PAS domain S-box protein [Alienimonas californiensis]QDT15017.1 Non-motile and phage-resistance protein [Alienimonas californiensis]